MKSVAVASKSVRTKSKAAAKPRVTKTEAKKTSKSSKSRQAKPDDEASEQSLELTEVDLGQSPDAVTAVAEPKTKVTKKTTKSKTTAKKPAKRVAVAKVSEATSVESTTESAISSDAAKSELVDKTISVPRFSVTRATSRLPRTFQLDTLEDSFLAYAQFTSQPPDPTPLPQRVKRLKASDTDFINNPEFANESAEAKFLGDQLLYGVLIGKGTSASLADLPPHLARLCETKLLTPEEEQLLFQRLNYLRYRASEMILQLDRETATEWDVERIDALLRAIQWHRDCIVKANMRLVISIVKKFVNAKNAFDDLLSDGIVALMRAVDKFDFDRGFRFSTYATQVVRRNAYRQVVTSQQERLKVTNSVHEVGVDISDEDRQPTMSEDRWYALRTKLGLMLDNLDRREKLIVRARFSLGSHRRVQTLQGLADRLGVSKERVRQLEKRALDKLRGMADDFQFQELETE